MRRDPKPAVLEHWRQQADQNGSKIITIRALLRAFGMERRGVRATIEIEAWLRDRDLFVSGLRVGDENAIDDSIERSVASEWSGSGDLLPVKRTSWIAS